MPWQTDTPTVRTCGICAMTASRHHIVRWSHRVAGYCTPDHTLESDLPEHVLELALEGRPGG